MRYLISLFVLFFLSQLAIAQSFQAIEMPFVLNNDLLPGALAGGLNSPQFSKIDFNNDGVEDIYIFDRVNNAHLPFIVSEENGTTTYTYDYSFAQYFPQCKSWVALRDYNGDGITDLFSYSAASQVYKGKYVDGHIAFDKVELLDGAYLNFLTYYTADNDIDFISLFPDDYPVIEDVDGDGDLDILAFGGNASVNFYQNQAVEYGYPLDSLVYTLVDECWGRFARDAYNEVILSNDIDLCASGIRPDDLDNRAHLTLTLMVYDEDEDGDMDAIVGSATSRPLTKLTNNGPVGTAHMTEQFPNFPSYDVPVDIFAYPTAFYMDIDNDGQSEFLAAPNQVENGEDQESVWMYKNVGTPGSVLWELQQKNWLVDDMIDLGTSSAPAFFDYNADGLLDMVVGTGGEWLWTDKGQLVLFENTGTETEPQFTLVEEDWLSFSLYNDLLSNFTPCFGDLDNDGDLDLLCGSYSGELIYAENLAGPGAPVDFDTPTLGWNSILVGRKSAPQMADINRDGLLDLLIGERSGNINYLPNIGSLGDPQFDPLHEQAPNNQFFGEISTTSAGLQGNATPLLVDRGTHFLLIVASGMPGLRLYEFDVNDIDGNIPALDLDWGAVRMGDNLYPAVADLNNNGFMEMILGNRRGGLTALGTTVGVTSTREDDHFFNVSIFPNPVNDQLTVQIPETGQSAIKISIYNQMGQLVKEETNLTFHLGDLPKGVYLMEVVSSKFQVTKKFIRQ